VDADHMKLQDDAAAEVVAAIDEWIRLNGHLRTDAWQRLLAYAIETFGYASMVRFIGLALETPHEMQLGAELIRIDRGQSTGPAVPTNIAKAEPGWIARLRIVYAKKNGTNFPEVN